jgi:hypothetical protein
MKKYRELLSELPSKTVVVTFGQFNPPSVGHELLVKVVRKLAKQRKADHSVFVSSVQDKKNPLEVSKKIQYLETLFPNTKFVQRELGDAIHSLKRYKNVVVVSPAESVEDYKKMFKRNNIGAEFVQAGAKCPDSDDKLIKLATKGEYQSFKTALPTSARELDAKRLMNDVRNGIGLESIKEQINLVKDELREQYFRGEIFNEGDIVESNDTVYKIVKRGSNHLLLQNEQGLKISKWIQEVQLTEREFMLDEKQLQEADATSATGVAKKEADKAAADTAKAQQKLKFTAEKEALAKKQEREAAALSSIKTEEVVNTKSKYNIAKSVMSLSDFRKSMGQAKPEGDAEEKELEKKSMDGLVGNTHIGDDNHGLRHMKVKHHLGEETDEQAATRKAQLKRFKDQAADAKLGTGDLEEARMSAAVKLQRAFEREQAKSEASRKRGEEVMAQAKADAEKKQEPVKEEFDEISDDELQALVEADLDALTEADFFEAYDDEELAIIDDETGEEIESVSEEVNLDSPALMEVLSRHERIMAKARMRRTKAKRVRAEKVALRKFSTPQVANKRARRMAISAMKKRLLRGQNPQKVSVGQRERIERFIAQRKKVVDRLSARMVQRVKQVEKARMSHKKFTKPNNGVTF